MKAAPAISATVIESSVQRANPFVSLPGWLKNALIFYVLIYDLLLPVASWFGNNSDREITLIAVALGFVLAFVKILPIVYPFPRVGLIHPLVFPLLLSLARDVVTNPFELIVPFIEPSLNFDTSVLGSGKLLETAQLNIQKRIIEIIGYACIYLGYFSLSSKRKRYRWLRPEKRINFKTRRATILVGLGLISLIIYFQSKGGLLSWISTWGQLGRAEALEGEGPLIRYLNSFYFVTLAWYLIKGNKAFRSPIFWIGLLTFLLTGFLTTGSRSMILDVILAFMLVWIVRNKRLPTWNAGIAAFVIYFLFGTLGAFRASSTANRGNLDVNVLTDNLSTQFERASSELLMRSNLGPEIAIYSTVPEEVDYLYGKTYMAFVFFWVPSSIWPDKPNGAGKYAGELIYGINAGVPPNAFAEAFWNFGFLGIPILFFINGLLLRMLSNFYVRNSTHPGVIVLYILCVSSVWFISSIGMTELFQRLIFVFIWLKYLKVL